MSFKNSVELVIITVMENFDLSRRQAMKYLAKAFERAYLIEEISNQIEYEIRWEKSGEPNFNVSQKQGGDHG